ncbi:prepilin-type N-terminal cleavage/methylation domain-containing protein [Methylomarinum sp. Ch1-1]|uniref:Prepilin-type N-terminal cleavage/methylation domain-containing protein n=1 Tax=Methylomarinum roseum TaxID=3067653 RepID=A0AAU7NZ02_9GAMM|nr:prepilin-type N-terminal cleavage/methylation domain-containing protein [Methylomarinum sp. Ch1-1]MDP4521740.1 prepilin-type N-terminal cleavage/methylation domain-containing protein [Methylomarinum sp. Ch1-1]
MNQSLFTLTAPAVGCAPRTKVVVLVRGQRCAERTLPFCAGFTLLEMVLVLFLVGLMASAAMMLTEGVEDQAKYDETKRRMEMIRKAIVGDPTRTVNGGPEISGFVADMGRLPGCLAELLELGDEKTPVTDPRTFESPCDSSVTITEWNTDTTTGIGFGWRGPYIHVLPERNGELRFRDGYGNSDTNDALNSGWDYTVTGSEISLTSSGFDVLDPADDVNADKLVVGSDWQVTDINVTFKNESAGDLPVANEDLVLRVYLNDSTSYVDGGDGTNNYLRLTGGSVAANGTDSRTFIFSTTSAVPLGSRAYAIVCHDAAEPDADNFVLFDGNCDSDNGVPGNNDIRKFIAAPRLSINLEWIVS